MKRRDFIGALMASVAGAAVVPDALLWRPALEPADLPLLASDALITLNQITRSAFRYLEHRLSEQGLTNRVFVDGTHIGHPGLTKQFNVMLDCPPEVTERGLDQKRYIEPAMDAIAERLIRMDARRFGALSVPIVGYLSGCSIRSERLGLALRGILAPRYITDDEIAYWGDSTMDLRFDVLAG
jgi:hypothetical protein